MRPIEWRVRLDAVVHEYRHAAFAWGTHDCVTFAAHVATAVSGVDIVARMHAKYAWHDALSAMRIVKDAGGLPNLVSEFLGAPTLPFLARHGDLVLAYNRYVEEGGEERALTVHLGDHLLGPGAAGLIALPPYAARLVWRIE